MPDFGLAKSLAKAVAKGAEEAVVKRPGQIALEEAAKKEPIRVKAGELIHEPAPTEAPTMAATPAADPTAEAQPQPAPIAAKAPPEPPVTLDPASPNAVQKKVPAPAPEPPPMDVQAEASRLSKANLGDYALDATHQPNFDTITTTDDIKAVIADTADQNAGKINEARRGIITEVQLRGLADDLDLPNDVVRVVMERESGGTLNAERVLAARQVLNSSADRIKNLADKITTGQASDIEKLQFRRQLQFHAEYQTQLMGARAEAGRALNAFKIPTGADVNLSAVNELIDSANGYDTVRIAKTLSMTDNTSEVTQLARKYTQSKLMGALNELFINSILSGPKTHIINAIGNTMMQGMVASETAVAARLGRFLSGDEHVMVGEAAALIHGTIGGWRDGLTLAAKTMRSGVPLDDVLKFESGSRRSISSANLLTPEQRATPLGAFTGGLVDFVGPVIRAPTERVMAPTDELFKTVAYRAEMERQAFLHVYDQVSSGAIKVSEAADVARDFMENSPKHAQDAAEDYAKYVTFQNPLDTAGARVQMAMRAYPVLSLIAPFVRTPVNIFKAGIVDRSPLGLFTKKFRQTMQMGGRERDMMLARISMGTATSAVVANYVVNGDITGGGPTNPEARALLEASGWQPYSIRITNPFTGDVSYHSYARAEPLAFVIGATADAVETMSYINSDVDGLADERQQVNNAASAIIVGIANNTMSKTYMKGISDFTEMMNDPTRYFQGWAKSMATAIVPYSSFRSQMGQIDDPYMREAWGILDNLKVKSGIPGWSADAPPRRDVFGQPRMWAKGSVLGSMSPFPDTAEVKDPVLDEVVNLMHVTRDVPLTMPSKAIEGMRLDAKQYDELVQASRTRPAGNGKTFHEALQDTMNNPTYANATPDMRVEMLKSIQHSYDQIGRIALEKEDPVFAAQINAYRQKRNQLRFGR